MKKIVLLGDSIRLWGYGTKVPQLLGDEYEVCQPEDNCRFAKYTLRGIFDWNDIIKDADVKELRDECGMSLDQYFREVFRCSQSY